MIASWAMLIVVIAVVIASFRAGSPVSKTPTARPTALVLPDDPEVTIGISEQHLDPIPGGFKLTTKFVITITPRPDPKRDEQERERVRLNMRHEVDFKCPCEL